MLIYFIFMDEDGFTLVKGGRQAKKRKAEGSPQLNLPPGVVQLVLPALKPDLSSPLLRMSSR